jgi:hypothetical protein
MTVTELRNALDLQVLSESDPDRAVTGGYAGDLLSWVMGRAQSGDAWVTIMTNINVLAVASLAGVSAVVVAENAEIEGGIVEKAKEQGINLLRSRAPIFETVLAIGRELGL